MPVPSIIFHVTQAGRDAAAYAFNNLPSGKLSLQTIKVGSGKYTPTGSETHLQAPYLNTFSIGGGGVQEASGQIRFTPILLMSTRLEVFEIGLYSDAGVLFAVAATPSNTPLLVLEADIAAIFSMSIAFGNVDADSIEVIVDVNAPLAIVMMGQHVSAAHPHSQYKRTLDNTERLKIADAVTDDEAFSKGQLRAFAITHGLRNDFSANSTGGANLNTLVLAGRYWIENNNPNRAFDYGILEVENLSESDVMQVMYNRLNRAVRYGNGGVNNTGHDWDTWQFSALLNGNSGQAFKVAAALSNDDAVRLEQLQSEATTRAGVDSALAGQIAQEVLDRQAGDSSLSQAINFEATTRANADSAEITARENGDLALAIALAAEITNRENLEVIINRALLWPSTHSQLLTGLNNVINLPPYHSIRVFLFGAGAGGGGVGGGSEFANDGTDGGDSVIYKVGDASNFILKAKGGLKGTSATYANGSAYTVGIAGQGGVIETRKAFEVAVLSYSKGRVGGSPTAPDEIDHPVIAYEGLTDKGRGGVGGSAFYSSTGGSGGSGGFVEAIIKNITASQMSLRIDCGSKGIGGTGSRTNGGDGFDGACLVFTD
jgi:hypothetical protein